MNKIKNLLFAILISTVIVAEGAAFYVRPRLIVDRDDLFEEEVTMAITAAAQQSSAGAGMIAAEEDSRLRQQAAAEETKEEQLALELLGTAIVNPKDPIAFIKDLRSQKQGMYKLGNKIQEAKLIKIAMGEVTLEISGRQECLKLSKRARAWARIDEDNGAVISARDNGIVLSRQGLLKEIKNVLGILPKVTVKPYYEAKNVAGLMVDGIPDNSVVSAAGIRNKDVVKSVNNQKIDSYGKALQVFSKVKNQPEITVTLLRDGAIQNLNYVIRN